MREGAVMENDSLDRDVRLRIFAHVAETSRMPSADMVAESLDVSQAQIEAALQRLAAARLLVLAPTTTNVWLAPPFSAVPTDFRVQSRGITYWAVCIWDALGIPAALHADADITARCGASGDELRLTVRDGRLAESEGIVHFGVPAAHWWDNIGFA